VAIGPILGLGLLVALLSVYMKDDAFFVSITDYDVVYGLIIMLFLDIIESID